MSFILDDEARARVVAEHILVWRALHSLENQNPHWGSNVAAFGRMDFRARYQWYERMKDQADKGLPTARTLIGEVLALRLKS